MMKRLLSTTLLMVLAVTLFASSGAHSAAAPQTVSVVFTNDMHSHMESDRGSGGFARVATVINRAREANPDTLVLDAGDFSMGTPFQTIFSDVASEMAMMYKMGYDATTLGNHEFDYRTKGLVDMLNTAVKQQRMVVPLVVSNIDWTATMEKWDYSGVGAAFQQIFSVAGANVMWLESGGAKILVFGLMGKEADSFAPESGVVFADPIESAKKIVAEHGDKADMIICLSHGGTSSNKNASEDELLAAAVPEIDFIISGHSHTVLEQPIVVGDTVIGAAGAYTNYAGTAIFERDGDRWRVGDYELVRLDESVPEDEAIAEEVDKYRTIVDGYYFTRFGYEYDQVLAFNDIDFASFANFGKQGGNALGDLIADSYIYAVEQAGGAADVTVVPNGVVRGSFAVGDVTVADAFNVSSLGIGPDGVAGYPLVAVYLTGAELRAVAEVDASVSTLMSEARLYTSGLQYEFNPNRLLLNRVTDVKLYRDNSVIEDIKSGELYRVVGDLYSCQMLGTVKSKSYGLLSLVPKDKDGNPITDFEQHIIYNQSGAELKAWQALASYIDSFDGDRIADDYAQNSTDRKIITDSKNIFDLLKAPNKIFFILLAAILLVLAIIVTIVVLTVRAVRKRRKKVVS